MCTMRKRGVSSAVICTESFEKLAINQSRVFGVPDLQRIVIPHPLGGLPRDKVVNRGSEIAPRVAAFIADLAAKGGA